MRELIKIEKEFIRNSIEDFDHKFEMSKNNFLQLGYEESIAEEFAWYSFVEKFSGKYYGINQTQRKTQAKFQKLQEEEFDKRE